MSMPYKLMSICCRASRARFKLLNPSPFLCPGATRSLPLSSTKHRLQRPSPFSQFNLIHTSISSSPPPDTKSPDFEKWALNQLPIQCPGCGAPSQIVDKLAPGYYNLKRHAIKKYLGITRSDKKKEQDEIVRLAIEKSASANLDIELGTLLPKAESMKSIKIYYRYAADRFVDKQVEVVKCCRCRNLVDHGVAISIQHPSVNVICDMLEETPYKYNRIYHVIDAADFPMSVIPDLHHLLNASPLRSKNRRSKVSKFYQDKIVEVSFIIARSDLLAPLKEQVDSLMPYFRLVLRDALGKSAAGMRLGNIHCVSVKRDWWTKELKEEVWNYEGAGWMVGKVNVGKSQLFSRIFPKGRKGISAESGSTPQQISSSGLEDSKNDKTGETDLETKINHKPNENHINDVEKVTEAEHTDEPATECQVQPGTKQSIIREPDGNNNLLDPESLLFPAPSEVNYPTMPIASVLPGTTISPIRLLYGNGKGELIDLPGLQRGDLEQQVKPAHRSTLLMRSRIQPEQLVILPGQSLLLGGFIRITPTSPDITFLAHAFTSINPHVTHTPKAIGTQMETRIANVPNIAIPGTSSKIASAGEFLLKWDVTKIRTGPVTSHDAGRVKLDQLPFRVIGIDIIIEGCGWVELSVQVSKKRGDSIILPLDINSNNVETPQIVENVETGEIWPAVEVFTPNGKYITDRRPMNAWSFIKKKSKKSLARPRRPIAGVRETVSPDETRVEWFSQF